MYGTEAESPRMADLMMKNDILQVDSTNHQDRQAGDCNL